MESQRVQELFFTLLRSSPSGSLAKLLDLEREALISYYMDLCPIQDSFRFRAKFLGLRSAALIIDEKGDLHKGNLQALNQIFSKGSYLLGPEREGDALLFQHLQQSLQALERNPEIWTWIKKFSPPLVHKQAEQMIRETLWPESVQKVQTPEIRRAVAASWLTLLRQTTGSCFATAPAILIQRNHPIRFFKDLYDLLSTGRMKRVVAGKEYAVPLTANSGKNDLQKPLEISADILSFSPGFMSSLEAAGLLNPALSLDQKIGHIHSLLQGEEELQTIEKLLRSISLKAAELSEEDLENEEHLSRIQMSPLLAKHSAVYYQKPSERAQKVTEWKKRFAKACATFQSFADCPLLRAWEYTLASFCDVKIDFARWNLYVGLGLHFEQKGGIGHFLYNLIDRHLQKCNEDVARLHQEYEQALGASKGIESAIYSSLSDSHRNQLKGELSSFIHAANTALEMRDRAAVRAEALAKFYTSLLQQFDQKFQDYFQELFDPSLSGYEAHLYEDSPAGFRLVYKHGRADPSQWTAIHNGEEYIQSLRDFFSTIEREIEMPPQIEREFLTDLMTALIQFIQEPEFLETALLRSKERGRRSPWDYISGGTMETLLQAYWGRDLPFTEASLVAHSEREVLSFLVKEAHEDPLLVHSPTHAFILHAKMIPSKWELLLQQNQQWLKKWKFDEIAQEHIAHRLSEKLPNQERHLFLHLFRQKYTAETIPQFRSQLIETLQSIKGSRLRNPVSLVDSIFYESMPILSADEAKKALDKLGLSLPELAGSVFGSYEFFQIAKEALLKHLKNPISNKDWDREIAEKLRQIGCAYPHPLLFADSNWSGWFFGFILNPGTHQLELWRLNRIGNQGYPMTDWKEWMVPKNTSPWVLLTKSREYTE